MESSANAGIASAAKANRASSLCDMKTSNGATKAGDGGRMKRRVDCIAPLAKRPHDCTIRAQEPGMRATVLLVSCFAATTAAPATSMAADGDSIILFNGKDFDG